MSRTALLRLSTATLFLATACSSVPGDHATPSVGSTTSHLASAPLRGSFGPTASRGRGSGSSGASGGAGAPFRTSRRAVKSRVTTFTPDSLDEVERSIRAELDF